MKRISLFSQASTFYLHKCFTVYCHFHDEIFSISSRTQFQFNVEHDSLIFKLLFVPISPCSEIIIRSDSSALLKCHLTLWSRSLSTAGAVLSLGGGGEGRGDICVINISSICSYFHQQTTEINNPQFKMLFNSWSVIWQACVSVCVCGHHHPTLFWSPLVDAAAAEQLAENSR